MKRVAILIAFAMTLLATGTVFFACSRTDQPAAPIDQVTLAWGPPPYSALVDIALAKGFFRKQGLDVTPHFHSTGKAALDEVLAGTADYATVAGTPLTSAIMSGKEIAITATIQSSNRTNVILARKDKGIHTPKDLKGRRIAASLGTSAEYFLDAFLATHGVARKEVEVVDLKPEEIAEALVRGVIDAASTWHPILNQGQQKLGEKGITFYAEEIYTQTFNLTATREQVRSYPARVERMLLALIEAEEFARRNPGEAQKTISNFRQADLAVLGAVWAGNTFAVTLDQPLLLALEDESQWAMKKELTSAREVPNYLRHIYFDGLKTVKPEAVRILK